MHEQLHDSSANSELKGFTKNKTAISAGVGDIGKGIEDLAHSVSDCHLEDLLDILTKLATKLGTKPEIEVVEEILKILIDGVQIEEEIASALEDYADQNWAGFGYNLIKLIKTLLKSEQVKQMPDNMIVI